MNRKEGLVEIQRLLAGEPSVQKRWVWECRERILDYLIARYGPNSLDRDVSLGDYEKGPPTGRRATRSIHGQMSPYQVRSILEDIAHLNQHSRTGGQTDSLFTMRN